MMHRFRSVLPILAALSLAFAGTACEVEPAGLLG